MRPYFAYIVKPKEKEAQYYYRAVAKYKNNVFTGSYVIDRLKHVFTLCTVRLYKYSLTDIDS